MKKQSIIILSLITIGSLFSVVYAATTIVSDDGIITSNLVVTGTCTGCSVSEGNFTSYSVILNETIATTSNVNVMFSRTSNDGSVFYTNSQGGKCNVIALNGTTVYSHAGTFCTESGEFYENLAYYGESMTGKYKIIFNGTDYPILKYDILKNNVLIQTLTSTGFLGTSNGGIVASISNDGKYIAILGIDGSNSIQRITIFVGS